MSKTVYLVILLSCITILINGVPIPSEDSDDSSSSSSSEESSDESKSKEKISNPSQSTNSNQNNPGQQPQVPQNFLGSTQSLSDNLQSTAVPSSTIPPDGNLNQNNPNIGQRDTTIVHTNAHQGGPEQTSRIASSSTERSDQYGNVQTSNENRQLSQNRQARDTNNFKPPSLLASSSTERSESQNKNGQTSNDDHNQYRQKNQNRQVKDTNNDNKPPSLLTSSSTERSENQNKNVQTSNADNNQYHQKDQNRQAGETNKNNNNPPSLLASSSTERSENQYRNVQPSNENSIQNRQRRDTAQETQAKVIVDNVNPVPSSPSEPQFSTYGVKPQSSSSVPTLLRNTGDEKTPADQLAPKRIVSSDLSSSRTTDNLPNTNGNIQTGDPNGNQDRNARDVDNEKTSSSKTFTSTTSSSENSSPSDTTSTTRHSIFNTDTTTEETTESHSDSNENTDRTKPTPDVSSTQKPGDIYGENLRKTTGPSRSIRESVPRVVTVSPYDTSFLDQEGNSQNNGASTSDTNRNEQKNPPSLTDTNTPENSEYSSGSKKYKRDDTAEDKSVKILTPSGSLDGSTLKPVSESSTEKSETTNAPDEVIIEKLYETPLFPRSLQ